MLAAVGALALVLAALWLLRVLHGHWHSTRVRPGVVSARARAAQLVAMHAYMHA